MNFMTLITAVVWIPFAFILVLIGVLDLIQRRFVRIRTGTEAWDLGLFIDRKRYLGYNLFLMLDGYDHQWKLVYMPEEFGEEFMDGFSS